MIIIGYLDVVYLIYFEISGAHERFSFQSYAVSINLLGLLPSVQHPQLDLTLAHIKGRVWSFDLPDIITNLSCSSLFFPKTRKKVSPEMNRIPGKDLQSSILIDSLYRNKITEGKVVGWVFFACFYVSRNFFRKCKKACSKKKNKTTKTKKRKTTWKV